MALASQCAPHVAPDTLLAVARHESRLHPWIVHNNKTGESFDGDSVASASEVARRWIGQGQSVDLGLMQINSANLGWLALGVEEAFEPCANIGAGGRVLEVGYAAAVAQHGTGLAALRATLSLYNTGSPAAGLTNGYVVGVEGSAQSYRVPSIAAYPLSTEAPPVVPGVPRTSMSVGLEAEREAIGSAPTIGTASPADAFGAQSRRDGNRASVADAFSARGGVVFNNGERNEGQGSR